MSTITIHSHFDAAASGDLSRLREAVDQFPDEINESDSIGRTPLIYATKFQHRECIQFLLQRLEGTIWEAIVETTDEDGNSPLSLVIEQKNWDQLERFLLAIAAQDQLDAVDWADENLLHIAGYQRCSKLVEMWIRLTVKMDSIRRKKALSLMGNDGTPIMVALQAAAGDVFQALITAMNEVESGWGNNGLIYSPASEIFPLFEACDNLQSENIIRKVFEMITTVHGREKAEQELDQYFSRSSTPLCCTPRHQILQSPQDPNIISEMSNFLLPPGKENDGYLHAAAWTVYPSKIDSIVAVLRWGGVEVDALDSLGRHPLFYASFVSNFPAIQILKAVRDQSQPIPGNTDDLREYQLQNYHAPISDDDVIAGRFTVFFSQSLVERCLDSLRWSSRKIQR